MPDPNYPDLWRIVRIADVCHPTEKVNPNSQKDGHFRYIDIASIDNEQKVIIRAEEIPNAEAPSRARQLVATDDVLVSTVRPNLNAVAIVPERLNSAICSTGFCVLHPNIHLISPHYLFAWVRHPEFVQRLTRIARGISYPAVSDSDVYKLRIPLPPLPEQERIVEILREADELRRQQQAALTTAQTLIPALFHHMFGEQEDQLYSVDRGQMLGDFVEVTSSLVDPQLSAYRNLYHVGSDNIESKTGRLIELTTIKEVGAVSGKFLFTQENILYSKIRPALRKVATPDFAGLCSADIYPLSYDSSRVSKQYLTQLLRSEHFTTYIARVSGRAQIPKVNRIDLLKYRTVLPDMDLQLEFEEHIQEVIQIQKAYQESLEKFESFLSSVLIQAFTGELSADYRLINQTVLENFAMERDAFLGRVRQVVTPVVEEEVHMAGVLMGRDTLAHSLSLSQRTLLQTIVTYLTENGRRYFTLSGFLDDHNNLPVNAVRQNVELLEKVGLLTRVSRQVAPEGIPYFETFYRLTTPLAREAAA